MEEEKVRCLPKRRRETADGGRRQMGANNNNNKRGSKRGRCAHTQLHAYTYTKNKCMHNMITNAHANTQAQISPQICNQVS